MTQRAVSPAPATGPAPSSPLGVGVAGRVVGQRRLREPVAPGGSSTTWRRPPPDCRPARRGSPRRFPRPPEPEVPALRATAPATYPSVRQLAVSSPSPSLGAGPGRTPGTEVRSGCGIQIPPTGCLNRGPAYTLSRSRGKRPFVPLDRPGSSGTEAPPRGRCLRTMSGREDGERGRSPAVARPLLRERGSWAAAWGRAKGGGPQSARAEARPTTPRSSRSVPAVEVRSSRLSTFSVGVLGSWSYTSR